MCRRSNISARVASPSFVSLGAEAAWVWGKVVNTKGNRDWDYGSRGRWFEPVAALETLS